MKKQCEPFCRDYKTCNTLCNDYSEKIEKYAEDLSFFTQMESDWKAIKEKYEINSASELIEELKRRGEYEKCVVRLEDIK